MSNSRCVEVPFSEWTHLREVFKVDWPRHCLPYINIQNYERLHENMDTKIYCLNGDWSDGTIILKVNIIKIFYEFT